MNIFVTFLLQNCRKVVTKIGINCMEMLHRFCLCSPRNKKREVKTLDDLGFILLNEINVDLISDTICLEILKDIVALQNEDKE